MKQDLHIGIRLSAKLTERLDAARHDIYQSRSRFIRDSLEGHLKSLDIQRRNRPSVKEGS